MAWQVLGTGPLADHLRMVTADLNTPLAAWLIVPAADDPNPLAVADDLAANLPPVSRDDGGEWRATGLVVLILDHAALVPGAAPGATVRAGAAAVAGLRDAALRLAPRLRVNALALDPAAPGDPGAILTWLADAHAVTGQLIRRGLTTPRPAGPERRVNPAVPPLATD